MLHQRALPAAASPHHDKDLAWLHPEVHLLHDDDRAITHGEVLHLNPGMRGVLIHQIFRISQMTAKIASAMTMSVMLVTTHRVAA